MGMEGLSAKGLERALGLLRQKHALGAKTRPVNLVAQQGMSDRGQMHPNLVGAAGFEAAQEQAGDWLSWPRASPCRRARPVRRAVAFEHFPVGYRLAPALAHCHAVARLRVTVDRPVDGAARPIRCSPDEGEIGALERLAAAAMVGELCRERAVREVALRYDHEAGRILVEPMHDAR